jgi:DNA-binding transcriptional LysR family regulator
VDRLAGMAVFVAAVEAGSLSGAARRFGLSASMAGKHVSAIEAELNVRLLHRNTRQLILTDVGQVYYSRCKRILEEYDEANREASDAQQSVQGLLRIAAPVTFGTMHLGDVIARYMDKHPNVTIDLLLNDRYVDLLSEGVDVAIRIGRLLDSDLVARRLAPCLMVLCASPAFLQRYGISQTVEDIRRAPRLVFTDAVSAGAWALTAPDGQTFVIDGPTRMTANNAQMLLEAALAGAGLAYGPSFVFGPHVGTGELIRLLPEYATSDLAIHALYPAPRNVSRKVRLFIDQLVTDFGGQPPWDRALMGKPT